MNLEAHCIGKQALSIKNKHEGETSEIIQIQKKLSGMLYGDHAWSWWYRLCGRTTVS